MRFFLTTYGLGTEGGLLTNLNGVGVQRRLIDLCDGSGVGIKDVWLCGFDVQPP